VRLITDTVVATSFFMVSLQLLGNILEQRDLVFDNSVQQESSRRVIKIGLEATSEGGEGGG
jgi:hypothetical protein